MTGNDGILVLKLKEQIEGKVRSEIAENDGIERVVQWA
jgi:hypothetical protein